MKRVFAPLAVFAAIAIASGAAFGLFSSFGSGSGPGSVGSLSPVSISSSVAAPATALLPGGTADTTFNFNNPNPVSVTIVSVVASGTIAVSGGSGCTPSNSGVAYIDQTGLSISVPATSTNVVVDLPGSLTMTSGSDDGCQGASFLVPVVVTAEH
jgi:hypothetical protein